MDWEFVLLAIGTGAAVLGVAWAVFVYLVPRKGGGGAKKVTAKGGVAADGDLRDNTITIGADTSEKRTRP